jgi:GNAT superfamily N-acetyltransferase
VISKAQDGGSVRIVEAGDGDLESLVALFNAYRVFYSREPDLQSTRSFIARRLQECSTRFFLATVGGRAVGFVHLLPSFDTLAMRRSWILEDLFVEPAYRRRGAGAALLRHAETFARGTYAAQISLTTAHTNETAQRLYVAHDYVPDEVFRTYHQVLP